MTGKSSAVGAIDIGGTKIAIGVVSGDTGEILEQVQIPTSPQQGYPAALKRITGSLAALSKNHQIHAIGVSTPGPIDPLRGIYGEVGTLPGWQGAPIKSDLEQAFGVPVGVENDADAAALAEASALPNGATTLIYVTISTGIGAGIILNGRLYRGAAGAHPEIGHQIIDASAPGDVCYCGMRGCWESLASGTALETWVNAQLPASGSLTAAEICRRARGGPQPDPLCLRAIEREIHYLALGLANLVTIFCPHVIVLGGGLMRSADLFLDPVKEAVTRLCTQVPVSNTSIVVSNRSPLHAAAAAATRPAAD